MQVANSINFIDDPTSLAMTPTQLTPEYITRELDETKAKRGMEGVRELFEMALPESEVVAAFENCAFEEWMGDLEVHLICSEVDFPLGWQSGKFIWPASRALCRFLASKTNREKHGIGELGNWVLELGAGAGLVGQFLVQLMSMSATRKKKLVVCTDRDSFVLDMIERSDQLNRKALKEKGQYLCPLHTLRLNWGDPKSLLVDNEDIGTDWKEFERTYCAAGRAFGLIVGADLFYSTESILTLMATMKNLLAKFPETKVLLCSSFREDETTAIIERECKSYGIYREVLIDEIANEGVVIEKFVSSFSRRLRINKPFSQLQSSLRDIQKSEHGLFSRLRSISADIDFVEMVHKGVLRGQIPLFANLRCGEWYLPNCNAESCYFKSTDGHFGTVEFSTRRLNLNVLRTAAASRESCSLLSEGASFKGGVLVIDSTQKGKLCPDSFNRTLPVWCAVLNLVAHGVIKVSLPPWVSEEEAMTIEEQIPKMAKRIPAEMISEVENLLRNPCRRVLQPFWICADHENSTISQRVAKLYENNSSSHEGFDSTIPVFCMNASFVMSRAEEAEERRSWRYIQGAGDDQEGWSRGLTPRVFRENRDVFLHCMSNEECKKLVERLMNEAVTDIIPEDSQNTIFYEDFGTAFAFRPEKLRETGKSLCILDLNMQIDGEFAEMAKRKNWSYNHVPVSALKQHFQRSDWQERILPTCLRIFQSAVATSRLFVFRLDCRETQEESNQVAVAVMVMLASFQMKQTSKNDVNAILFKVQSRLPPALKKQPPPRRFLKEVTLFHTKK